MGRELTEQSSQSNPSQASCTPQEVLNFVARLKLCDANNKCVEFHDVTASWPLQTDAFVVFKTKYSNDDISKYEQLDEWEQSQAELSVAYELVTCYKFSFGFMKSCECPSELKDYNEISGKGKIVDLRVKGKDASGNVVYGGWVYSPPEFIEVPILFSEYE